MAPVTYAAWCTLLDAFSGGDDSVLNAMCMGTFVIDAGTATRFYLKVEGTYKKRKESWLDKFQSSFQNHNFKNNGDLEILLRNAKQNLSPLLKFIVLKGFPEDLQKTLRSDLENFIAEINKSLKDNVSKTSNGREATLLILNTFTLTNMPQQSGQEIENNTKISNGSIPPTGRKIIF